jgi:hypothetical protein
MPTTLPSDPFAAVGGWLLLATLGTLVLGAGLLLWGRSIHRILLMGLLAATGMVLGGPLAGRVGLETWAGRLIAAVAMGLLGYLLARAAWSLVAGGLMAALAAFALAAIPPGLGSPATSPAAPPAAGTMEAAPMPAPAPEPSPPAPVAAGQVAPRPSVWVLAARFGQFVHAMQGPRVSRQDGRELWSVLGLDEISTHAKAHGSLLGIVMVAAGAAGLVGGFFLPRLTVILATSVLGTAMLAAAAAVACGLWMPAMLEHRPDNYLALDGVWLGVLLVGLIFQGVCEYRSRHPAPTEEEGEEKPPKSAKGEKAGKKEPA